MLPTTSADLIPGDLIQLDHQATTPCHPLVVKAMEPWWEQDWGNASSRQHRLGLTAAAAVASARSRLASHLGVEANDLIFTSGATEANNLALLGHARARAQAEGRCGHVVTLATEHHAVLDPMHQLQREGFALTVLHPKDTGLIDANALKGVLRDDTQLVSVMVANNEIGVVQPMRELAELCQSRGITLHTDAAQAFGHLRLNRDELGCDLISLSAHKLNGPKGIGALVKRRNVSIQPLFWGGGQEQELRPGTLPVPLIVGFAAAADLAHADLETRQDQLATLRDQLWQGLKSRHPQLRMNGAPEPRLAHNLNITVPDVSGVRLHRCLKRSMACSSGSACSRGQPSHALQAIGLSRREAEASLRLSLGRTTTVADIHRAVDAISACITQLQDD